MTEGVMTSASASAAVPVKFGVKQSGLIARALAAIRDGNREKAEELLRRLLGEGYDPAKPLSHYAELLGQRGWSEVDGSRASVGGHHVPGTPFKYKHGWKLITPKIHASEMPEGRSREVSPEEFDALAKEGHKTLDRMSRHTSPTLPGEKWDKIVDRLLPEVHASWGGETIDPHTGEALDSHADKFAISVKPTGMPTISIPENTTRDQLASAMAEARRRYGDMLERDNYFLGVFHDDDNHRIDIDPSVVVGSEHEVEAVGAATHAVGGAYHFSDGNGYYPPHVADDVRAKRGRSRKYWAGYAQWHTEAVKAQYGEEIKPWDGESRASYKGHHVPGTPFKYKHGWIPVGGVLPKHAKHKGSLSNVRMTMRGADPSLKVKADKKLAKEQRWSSTRYSTLRIYGNQVKKVKLDKALGNIQLEHKKGDLKRRALPQGWDAAVQSSAQAIQDRIKHAGTLQAGKDWYSSEHRKALKRAKVFHVTTEQAAAVESATSPRCGYRTNQRVTDEILDSAPRMGETGTLHALENAGGGVMSQNRRPAIRMALGEDIDTNLTGQKRRAFYNNIMYPGQTDDVTVDTWMEAALADGLGISVPEAHALAAEKVGGEGGFSGGMGRALVADAVRQAAEAMGESPDTIQAAYWIDLTGAAAPHGGVGPSSKAKAGVFADARAAADIDAEIDDLDNATYDAILILEYIIWKRDHPHDGLDLGTPASGKADDSLAIDNRAAWTIVLNSPGFKSLGMTVSEAYKLAGARPDQRASYKGHHIPGTPTKYTHGWKLKKPGTGASGGQQKLIIGQLPDDWDEDWAPDFGPSWTPDLEPAQGVKNLTSKGRRNGAGTPDDPIDVRGDLDRALTLMQDGKHVRLNQLDEVSLLLNKIESISKQTATADKKPTWDFGLLTVRGTNLFAAQHRGIPRLKMPQLSGPAQPGTPAATKAGGAGKFADLSEDFAKKLRRDGIVMRHGRVPVNHLRATQMELNGGKVAGRAAAALMGDEKAKKSLKEPIFVTRDGYVIDGHHRWASNMMLDALDGTLGNDTYQPVIEIDLDIGAAIPYANKFAEDMGIAGRGVRRAPSIGVKTMEILDTVEHRLVLISAPAELGREDREILSRAGTLVHEPVIGGKGKGLWGHKGWQLPAYIQHVANDLIQAGHMKSRAIEMAIGIIKNWAHGHDGKGHRISAATQAKAVAALAEWTRLKLQAKLHHAAKAARQ